MTKAQTNQLSVINNNGLSQDVILVIPTWYTKLKVHMSETGFKGCQVESRVSNVPFFGQISAGNRLNTLLSFLSFRGNYGPVRPT